MNSSQIMISAIVAMSENHVIGKNNHLPWHLPADLKHFKAITTGFTIVMGRKTFRAIGKSLSNRQNIVMTRDQTFKAPDCIVVHSIAEVMSWAKINHAKQIFIIGGAEIYHQWLPYTQQIYLTIVHGHFTGETYFPSLGNEWKEIEREEHPADENNPYPYSFITLKKR